MNYHETDAQKLYQAQEHLLNVTKHYWLEHGLFSLNWWFLLVLATVPWLIWQRWVDKRCVIEILAFGLFIMGISSLLDTIGVSFTLWTYTTELIQMVPQLNEVDYCILPILYMFLYQLFPTWKGFIIASVIMAAGASFIAEPFFTWVKIYDLEEWNYAYSFPFYIAIAVVFKWLIQMLKAVENKHKGI